MTAFIGLGNVGSQYSKTKHNAGFWVVDHLAARWEASFKPGKGEFVFSEYAKRGVLLVKPTSGMNVSGYAVEDVASRWSLEPKEMCIVVDDVDLPLGKLRLRPRGGDGCHRGMASIISHLGTTDFPRLRVGIATDEKLRPAEEYVLKPFGKTDAKRAEKMVVRAADAAESLLDIGIEKTMNKYNS